MLLLPCLLWPVCFLFLSGVHIYVHSFGASTLTRNTHTIQHGYYPSVTYYISLTESIHFWYSASSKKIHFLKLYYAGLYTFVWKKQWLNNVMMTVIIIAVYNTFCCWYYVKYMEIHTHTFSWKGYFSLNELCIFSLLRYQRMQIV